MTKGPYADALRQAMRTGFGKDPALIREGGSIGAISLMERAWKVPILFCGLSLPEHGYMRRTKISIGARHPAASARSSTTSPASRPCKRVRLQRTVKALDKAYNVHTVYV